MYYRCELMVGGVIYDATDELVNWDDVEMSFKRGDYDGVVRSFSTKFQFANGAYLRLLDEYLSNYLNSSATIVFYLRNNSWLLNEKFRCALDFSTFTYNNTTCEINAVDNSLASLIKAKKGTQYEYQVSKLREGSPLNYDRLEMTSQIEWIIGGELSDNEEYVYNTYETNSIIPMYIKGTPEIAVKDIIEVTDVGIPADITPVSDLWFIRNISNRGISMNINFFATVTMQKLTSDASATLIIRQRKGPYTDPPILEYQLREIYPNTVSVDKTGYMLYANYGLVFEVKVTGRVKLTILNNPLKVTFNARGGAASVDVIKPVTLLNRLLKSINGGKDGIVGEIESGVDSRLDSAMIVPAESVRGLEDAKIYTSYTKFSNWMKAVFGFVPVVGENKVTFVHRDSLFQDKEAKDLQDSTSGLEYNVNAGMVYSGVKVGYDKQDYDSVNGRDEFRFTNEYTTGVTLTDNVLELVSPYRADAYGIEFLAAKRGEDTTDSDSDNDVFFVGAALQGEKYELIRGGYEISGVISPSTMFNAMYSQRFMIESNARYIAAFAGTLEFASSDGNSDVTINGVSEKSDIVLGNKLFTVGELSVETGDLETPSDLSGYITVRSNGKTYKGYVKSASYNYGKPKAVKYSLIVKSVE
ncbi:hypothetical protein [Bacteroides sp. OM08-17BH]|uniref:hypothetical protein n=1 Tax=Bacteroides sp. OM08-17BH TaxID=2292285 RepID=UPI000E453423|nr:hypothetical protein [Bacteroides sp. OM08-17BH]RGM26967.1 hypothetical protein DXC20_13245 [Bacteroides sp. OM08-17BH]